MGAIGISHVLQPYKQWVCLGHAKPTELIPPQTSFEFRVAPLLDWLPY